MFHGVMGFVVGPSEGTQLPGDFMVLIRVRGEETDGVMAVVEETLQPQAFIPLHVHDNDVWVYVLSGHIGVLVGDEIAAAAAGSWALKPRFVPHAMWNASPEPARIIEVLTPAGTERWFEVVTGLAPDDEDGFRNACSQYGIRFLTDSPWNERLRSRFGL
jgi:quercetin dioxygenase-like cupin family protein